MNTLIIMIGVPGCGKTTYSKRLLEDHPDWEYVSRDEVRYQYVEDKAHYFDHEHEVYKEFCNRIDMHLINEKTVIADATHLSQKSRNALLNTLTVIPDKIIGVVFITPFEECFRRNAMREGITRVPDAQMYKMRNAFKAPNPAVENFDMLIKVNGMETYDK